MCKWKQNFVLNSVTFWVEFFRFSNFQYLQKMGIFIFSLIRLRIFSLITHSIELFQTVKIQNG